MSRKYAVRDQLAIYSLTFTIVNWIDIFIRDVYKEKIIESLFYCQKHKNLNIHAYCVMTSHVHVILSVSEGELSPVIRDFKSHTAREIRALLEDTTYPESRREWLLWMLERAGKKNKRNGNFQLWQQHNHPIELSTNSMREQRLSYVHNNPVEAGFVLNPEDWIWSSARQYGGKEGDVVLSFIE